MRVAIFDFDGTLYEKETFQVLMDQLKNHPIYHTKYRRFLLRILPRFISYKMKIYPEERMKERSMQIYLSALYSLSEGQLKTYFTEVAEKMQQDLNPLVIEKLKEHLAKDFHVMLVSGAYSQLLHSAIGHFPFDTVIGTEIPFTGNNIDREKALYHINGARKNMEIHQALEGKQIDWSNSYAYADSFSDLPVLELVGNPVAVQPEPRLRTVARERKWKVM